jgi:hypothetical protein
MTMIHTSHQRALRAASAVTLGSSLAFACGGGGSVDDDSTTETQSDELESERPQLIVPDAPETLPMIVVDPDAVLIPLDNRPAVDRVDEQTTECSKELDGVCPESCNQQTDADCCEAPRAEGGMWCTYNSEWGCSCAVEGPFAPPA